MASCRRVSAGAPCASKQLRRGIVGAAAAALVPPSLLDMGARDGVANGRRKGTSSWPSNPHRARRTCEHALTTRTKIVNIFS
jgi:hypothetical protein